MVTEAVGAVTDAFTGLLSGVVSAVPQAFDALVLGSEGKMTTFATWAFLFLGIGLATWLFKKVLGKAG